LARCLLPGGVALIVTGNTEALTWRMHGSRYWYCSLPEHVSFFSVKTMQTIAGRVGMSLVSCRRLSHQRTRLRRHAKEIVSNIAYLAGRALPRLGSARLKLLLDEHPAPFWFTAPDHLFCVLRRQ